MAKTFQGMSKADTRPGAFRDVKTYDATYNYIMDGETLYYRKTANDTGALICLISKVGSSMWNFLLLKAARAEQYPDPDGRFRTSGHLAVLPIKASPMTYEFAINNFKVPRFAIVKHPLARLLSGYLGKVINNPTPGLWPRAFDPNTKLAGLIETMGGLTEAETFRNHFRLQSDQCAGKQQGIKPWTFLRVEEMASWYEDLLCSLGLSRAAASGWDQFQNVNNDLEKGAEGRSENPAALPWNRTHQSCFVSLGCGCKVDCNNRCANDTRNVSVRHGTFHHSTPQMEMYYDYELAARANNWAHRDLQLFNYRPWYPGMTMAETLINPM